MKSSPRDVFESLAQTLKLNEADRIIVARLVARFMALTARSVAGEDVKDELAMSTQALENVKAGANASAAKFAYDLLIRIAVAL